MRKQPFQTDKQCAHNYSYKLWNTIQQSQHDFCCRSTTWNVITLRRRRHYLSELQVLLRQINYDGKLAALSRTARWNWLSCCGNVFHPLRKWLSVWVSNLQHPLPFALRCSSCINHRLALVTLLTLTDEQFRYVWTYSFTSSSVAAAARLLRCTCLCQHGWNLTVRKKISNAKAANTIVHTHWM